MSSWYLGVTGSCLLKEGKQPSSLVVLKDPVDVQPSSLVVLNYPVDVIIMLSVAKRQRLLPSLDCCSPFVSLL